MKLLLGTRLGRSFFRRPTLEVARDLVGCLLIHDSPSGLVAGMIVETEGYTGSDDPGSHAARGPGRRNAPMFGPPGRAYVYKCHMYPLLNVVTEPEGRPGAVLIRALEPVAGFRLMARRSPRLPGHAVASGPGRLTRALGIRMGHNRADLVRGSLRLARPRDRRPRRGSGLRRSAALRVIITTRIGLKGPAALMRRRFIAAGNPCVSRV